MSSYDLYKPLRNNLRQFSLLDSLGVIRAYLQNLQFSQPFPRDIQVDRSYLIAKDRHQKGVFEWELEILAKELILNAPDVGTRDFKRWREFSTAVNKLKDLENEIAKRYESIFLQNILLELHRVAHRQIPWQQRPDSTTLSRYFKIFGYPDLDLILKSEIGLSAAELYTIGLLVTGHYLTNFGLDSPLNIDVPSVTKEQFQYFLSRFAVDIATLKKEIADAQSYDQDYAYTFNPLKMFPLVWVTLRGNQTLIAPVPTYLFRRFTEGIYYEIYNARGFSDAFGKSFQAYVGEVINVANELSNLAVFPERPYHIGKELKDSIDWIVSDETADLFIECKTKKLRYAAKAGLTSTAELEEDLDKMANFVVQVYKTIVDAKSGYYPHWKQTGRPLYPLIVTLEEWYAFGNKIINEIDSRVRAKLSQAKIDGSLLQTHPYSICATGDFEKMIQVMAQMGIDEIMAKKVEGECRFWPFNSFLIRSFRDSLVRIKRNLFPDELKKIYATGMKSG